MANQHQAPSSSVASDSYAAAGDNITAKLSGAAWVTAAYEKL